MAASSAMISMRLVTGTTGAAPMSRMSAGGAPSGARSSACFHAAFLLEEGMTAERLLSGMGDLYEVEPNTGCWLWTLSCSPRGYGNVQFPDKRCRTHRVMWEIVNGPIPAEMCVLHECDTPSCVNPQHLFIGTHADNNADMLRKGRQVYVRGSQKDCSKLIESDVVEIMRRRQSERGIDLAAEFGVSPQTICAIKYGRSWGWLAAHGEGGEG